MNSLVLEQVWHGIIPLKGAQTVRYDQTTKNEEIWITSMPDLTLIAKPASLAYSHCTA